MTTELVTEATDDRVIEMVELLMRGNTVKAIANHFDVSERTVYRWKTSELGRTLIKQAKVEHLDRAHRAISTAAATAVATLTEVAVDKRARKGDRVRAAEALLKNAGLATLTAESLTEVDPAERALVSESLADKFAMMETRLRRSMPETAPGELRAVRA
jgi:transposase-like protein